MNYQEFEEAVNDAEATMLRANRMATISARIIKGRLRSVSSTRAGRELLVELKRELSQFNARTGEWKS